MYRHMAAAVVGQQVTGSCTGLQQGMMTAVSKVPCAGQVADACLWVQDTRISRGDGGSVFVLVKDVSFSAPGVPLPSTTTAIVPIEDAPVATVPVSAPVTPAPYLSVSPRIWVPPRDE